MGHKPLSTVSILGNIQHSDNSQSTQGYQARLSLAPLFRYWHRQLEKGNAPAKLLAKEVMVHATHLPELLQPINDTAWLAKQTELLELMLSPVFPTKSNGVPIGAVYAPFCPKPFFHTTTWTSAFDTVLPSMEDDASTSLDFFSLSICIASLAAYYQQPLPFQMPEIFPVAMKGEDGLARFFRPRINLDFLEIKPIGKRLPFSERAIKSLLENASDMAAWHKLLPPDRIEINGFAAVIFEDVTTEAALFRFNSLLLRKNALKTVENITQLEDLMGSYFQIPSLRLGILSLKPNNGGNNFSIDESSIGILNWKKEPGLSSNPQSVYSEASKLGKTVVSEQFARNNEQSLKKHGIHSHLVAPLKNSNGQVIGLVELGASEPFAINSFIERQVEYMLLPQLSRCLEQQQEEYASRIEAMMRQKFTAIHPSVEWRFVEVAERYLAKLATKGRAVIEPILFKDIFPLYAQSDIINSSLTRNHAIRKDIKAQMQLVEQVLRLVLQRLDLPLLQHTLQRTETYVARLEDEMQTSDESFFMNFLLEEVRPLLRELADRGAFTQGVVQHYFDQLDTGLEIVYDQRKAYDESINLINEALSDLIDKADERAQAMTPHFFEKYQTDGVQFELYAGQSLLRQGKFSEFQLNNLRLWQLQTMCEVTRRMKELKQTLPMPLETAQLIFVYGQPISVRFRMDEKFFDVDGAYNIRYEIIKKRIDKACVLGSEERLTQPGKIAIVYATEPMRALYLDFCNFLVAQGLIEAEIEELELEKLQETQGLKALRVSVK